MVAAAAPADATEPEPMPPPAAATTAAAPEPEPADEPAAEPEPEPAAGPAPARDPSGFTAGFGDVGDEDEDEDEDDDEDGDEDDDEDDAGDDGPTIGISPTSQLSTVPGAEKTLEPPVLVGPSGNPRHKWIYSSLLAFRYNPLGLTLDFKTGHRLQLIDKDSVLFRESYLLSGMRVFTTPAYTRLGPHVEVQPLALINIYAGYNFVGYYSTFDLIQSYESPTDNYSDDAIEMGGERGENYTTFGQIADISVLLQAKVGPIAVRSNLVFYWANMKLNEGDRVWYDQFMDIAFPREGWGFTMDNDIIYLFPKKLKLGVRHSISHVFYDALDFRPGEPADELLRVNSPHHRIGPALLYTFFDRPEQRFNKPTFVLLTQWFFQHRYRTGTDTSNPNLTHVGIPQVVLAFTWQGDLLPHPQRRHIDRTGKKRRKRQDELTPSNVPAATEGAR